MVVQTVFGGSGSRTWVVDPDGLVLDADPGGLDLDPDPNFVNPGSDFRENPNMIVKKT